MQKTIYCALIALGSMSLLSADQNWGGCASGNCPQPGYGNQQNNRQYNRDYQSGPSANDQYNNQGRYFDEAIENRNSQSDNDQDDGDDNDNNDQPNNYQQRGPQSGNYQQGNNPGYNDQRGNMQQRGPGNYQQGNNPGYNDQRGNMQQRGPQSGNYQQGNNDVNAKGIDAATTEQDRQINIKIREKLRNWMAEKNLNALVIKTNNGEVVILGIVDKPEEIQKTNDQIKEIDGVKKVDNQVKLRQ